MDKFPNSGFFGFQNDARRDLDPLGRGDTIDLFGVDNCPGSYRPQG